MKRSLAILLLLCTLFALCACPGGGPVTPPDGPGGNDGKCPTCGKDPCECPEDGVCKNCGGVGCDVCDPADPVPIEYVTKYPYTETDADGMITAVHMTYQDTWTFPSSIRSMETVEITSFVCGTQEKDNDVLVIQPDGKTVYADGCGTVDVKFLGQYTVRVVVHPAPLNLLFVTGQSNAVADSSFLPTTDPENYNKYHHTYADYYPRTKAGKAYFTWTGQGLSIATGNGSKKPAECVPDTLDWELANRTFGWCRPDQFSLPVGQTTFSGAGWCSALANEWVAETNETVWIVNASHGGRAINTFLPSEDGTHIDNEYYQAVEVFNEALATLYREVDAGHFVLNHMAYYWYQGCADFTRTEDYYAEQLAKADSGWRLQNSYLLVRYGFCGFSSFGRASPCQGEGGGFEPRNPLHEKDRFDGLFLFFAAETICPSGLRLDFGPLSLTSRRFDGKINAEESN